MLNAGSLNRRITIQSQTAPQNNFARSQPTWTDTLTTWAGIRAATSKEVYAASGFTSQLTHVITIRYPSVTITTAMHILYDDRSFIIQAVSDPDESKVQLNLMCLEDNGHA